MSTPRCLVRRDGLRSTTIPTPTRSAVPTYPSSYLPVAERASARVKTRSALSFGCVRKGKSKRSDRTSKIAGQGCHMFVRIYPSMEVAYTGRRKRFTRVKLLFCCSAVGQLSLSSPCPPVRVWCLQHNSLRTCSLSADLVSRSDILPGYSLPIRDPIS